jgi:hypothetical protein
MVAFLEIDRHEIQTHPSDSGHFCSLAHCPYVFKVVRKIKFTVQMISKGVEAGLS